jgi:hypothetical protein
MTITKQTTFEGLPTAGSITSSNQNSDGTSGNALTISGTQSMGTCVTGTDAIYGTKSFKVDSAGGSGVWYQAIWWNGTVNTIDGNEPTTGGFRFAFKMTTIPTGITQIAAFLTSTGGTSHSAIEVRPATNRIAWVAGGGGGIETPSGQTLQTNTVYVVDCSFTNTGGTGTGTSKLKLAVYDINGNYALGTSAPLEDTTDVIPNATYTFIKRAQIGIFGSSQVAGNITFDNVQYHDSYTLLGPYVTGVTDSRPDATTTAGSWTYAGGAASIHGALADDTDTTYAQSSFNPSSDLMKVSLQPIADGSCVVPFTYWASAASPARSLTVSLRDSGGTQIASKTISNITATSPVSDSIVLSSGENAAFTDRTNPELWFTAS